MAPSSPLRSACFVAFFLCCFLASFRPAHAQGYYIVPGCDLANGYILPPYCASGYPHGEFSSLLSAEMEGEGATYLYYPNSINCTGTPSGTWGLGIPQCSFMNGYEYGFYAGSPPVPHAPEVVDGPIGAPIDVPVVVESPVDLPSFVPEVIEIPTAPQSDDEPAAVSPPQDETEPIFTIPIEEGSPPSPAGAPVGSAMVAMYHIPSIIVITGICMLASM